MIPYTLVLIVVCFALLILEQFIPPLAFLHDARVLLVPIVLFYSALALPYGLMLIIALAAGLMTDAIAAQVFDVRLDGGQITQTVEIALGWSIILYAVLGSVMSGFRPLFKRGRWEIHCLMSGILVALIVLAQFLMISVRRAALDGTAFVYTQEIGWRIAGAGVVALILAPILFWGLSTLAAFVGYNPRKPDTEEEPENV